MQTVIAITTDSVSAMVCAAAIPVNPMTFSIRYKHGSKIAPCLKIDTIVAAGAFPDA